MEGHSHVALFSPATLTLGKIHWALLRAAHLMDSRRYIKFECQGGAFTTEWTEFGHEIGTDEINWWVFKKEPQISDLKAETERALQPAQILKAKSAKLEELHPHSYDDLLSTLREFAEKHSREIESVYSYVRWLEARDPMAPKILFTYRVWGSTRMSDRTIAIPPEAPSIPDGDNVRLCTEIVLGLRDDSEREIPPFPNASVILKTAWELVKLDDDHPEDHHTQPLYIWNPQKQLKPGASLEDVSGWENSVVIDLSSKNCEDRDYTTTDGTVPVVPLGCFYYMELKNPKDFPHGLANMVGPFGLPRRTPVYLILVAVHVITKETPDWVWATFWWHNQASLNNRPVTIKGNKWRHFLVNTTLSPKTPLDASGGPRICFNPFLEETFRDGTRSNCMSCHSKAVFGRPHSVGIEPAPAGYFDNGLRTDFMWTIANVHNADIMNFLKNLQEVSTPP